MNAKQLILLGNQYHGAKMLATRAATQAVNLALSGNFKEADRSLAVAYCIANLFSSHSQTTNHAEHYQRPVEELLDTLDSSRSTVDRSKKEAFA